MRANSTWAYNLQKVVGSNRNMSPFAFYQMNDEKCPKKRSATELRSGRVNEEGLLWMLLRPRGLRVLDGGLIVHPTEEQR